MNFIELTLFNPLIIQSYFNWSLVLISLFYLNGKKIKFNSSLRSNCGRWTTQNSVQKTFKTRTQKKERRWLPMPKATRRKSNFPLQLAAFTAKQPSTFQDCQPNATWLICVCHHFYYSGKCSSKIYQETNLDYI